MGFLFGFVMFEGLRVCLRVLKVQFIINACTLNAKCRESKDTKVKVT